MNKNVEIFQNILEIYAGGEAHHNVEPTRGGFRDARTVKGLGEKVILSYLHEMIILYIIMSWYNMIIDKIIVDTPDDDL